MAPLTLVCVMIVLLELHCSLVSSIFVATCQIHILLGALRWNPNIHPVKLTVERLLLDPMGNYSQQSDPLVFSACG